MKCLIVAAALLVALTSASGGAKKLDRCTCYEKGNYYEPVSASGCTQFTQRTAFLPAKTFTCPDGLTFDVNVCVCNYAQNSVCPTSCQDYPPVVPPKSDYCKEKGNTYTPVPGTDCSQFTQATDILPPQKHSCPAGLQFNTAVCVCDYPYRTQCNN